jgi:uncharacterized protein (DUF305 family)
MKTCLKIAVVLAAVLAPAMARAEDMKKTMGASAGTPADKAFMTSMQKMMKDMNVKPTGQTDRDFVMMMMPHHQGAIDMAKIELQYGRDPMLRKMAGDIVTAQEQEIGEMKAWLAKNPR